MLCPYFLLEFGRNLKSWGRSTFISPCLVAVFSSSCSRVTFVAVKCHAVIFKNDYSEWLLYVICKVCQKYFLMARFNDHIYHNMFFFKETLKTSQYNTKYKTTVKKRNNPSWMIILKFHVLVVFLSILVAGGSFISSVRLQRKCSYWYRMYQKTGCYTMRGGQGQRRAATQP